MLYWINVDVINRTHSLLHFQQLSFKCLSNVYIVDIARQEARRSSRNWPITCVTTSWALKSVCLWQNCLGGTQIRSYPNSTKKESKNDTSRSNNNNTNKKESKHNKNNKNQTKTKNKSKNQSLSTQFFLASSSWDSYPLKNCKSSCHQPWVQASAAPILHLLNDLEDCQDCSLTFRSKESA